MTARELTFLRHLESIRTDFLDALFEVVTMLGEETVIIVLMAVVYFMFSKDLARKVFFITVVSLSSNCIIKNFVKRPRPFTRGISCVRPDTATGYSFPSGHTQTFATWSSAFGFSLKKRQIISASVIFTILVAVSRMYLGAHYPTDVIAGGLLGIGFGYAGNVIYEKIKNKNVLYCTVLLILTPFLVFFLINPDAQYEDFFKLYGMYAGFILSVLFEEKFVKLDNDASVTKKILRIVICVVLALVVKEALKALFTVQILRLSLVLDAVRYFVLVFLILGLCPLMLKKLKI